MRCEVNWCRRIRVVTRPILGKHVDIVEAVVPFAFLLEIESDIQKLTAIERFFVALLDDNDFEIFTFQMFFVTQEQILSGVRHDHEKEL